MTDTQYVAPTSIEDAVGALVNAGGNARVLAGGTDLLVQIGAGMIKTGAIVDIKNIPEANKITKDSKGFRIGAGVCGAQMNENQELKEAWPGVCEAVDLIGSTQIQGRATAVGNICNASPAADSVPALVAAGGVCTVVGPNGSRDVAVEDIPTGPGSTSLANDEFVVDVRLPLPADYSGDAYLRMIPRTEMDIAIVGAGVNLTLGGDGFCTSARVVLGAVAPTIVIVTAAAEALVGSKVDEEVLAVVSQACSAACNPIDDKRGTVAYRTKVAGVLARRATSIAFERARSK